jgi:hypothetical protein
LRPHRADLTLLTLHALLAGGTVAAVVAIDAITSRRTIDTVAAVIAVGAAFTDFTSWTDDLADVRPLTGRGCSNPHPQIIADDPAITRSTG